MSISFPLVILCFSTILCCTVTIYSTVVTEKAVPSKISGGVFTHKKHSVFISFFFPSTLFWYHFPSDSIAQQCHLNPPEEREVKSCIKIIHWTFKAWCSLNPIVEIIGLFCFGCQWMLLCAARQTDRQRQCDLAQTHFSAWSFEVSQLAVMQFGVPKRLLRCDHNPLSPFGLWVSGHLRACPCC